MLKISVIFVILFLFVSGMAIDVFDGKGNEIESVSGKTKDPVIIIDTIPIVAGKGTFNLNTIFNDKFENVSASSTKHMIASITQILTDSTASLYYYAYFPDSSGRALKIFSSGTTADTGNVSIILIVR